MSSEEPLGGWPTFAVFGKGGDLCRLRRDFDLVFTPPMDCCDANRRPRRSHLYRERRGGPATHF